MSDTAASRALRIEAHRDDVRFRILHALYENPTHSQRSLSRELGVGLGSVNFLLNALVDKGHVKVRNFRASTNKVGYAYVLTPQGIAAKARLTVGFLQRKRAEFEALRQEIEALEAAVAEDGQEPT